MRTIEAVFFQACWCLLLHVSKSSSHPSMHQAEGRSETDIVSVKSLTDF